MIVLSTPDIHLLFLVPPPLLTNQLPLFPTRISFTFRHLQLFFSIIATLAFRLILLGFLFFSSLLN